MKLSGKSYKRLTRSHELLPLRGEGGRHYRDDISRSFSEGAPSCLPSQSRSLSSPPGGRQTRPPPPTGRASGGGTAHCRREGRARQWGALPPCPGTATQPGRRGPPSGTTTSPTANFPRRRDRNTSASFLKQKPSQQPPLLRR